MVSLLSVADSVSIINAIFGLLSIIVLFENFEIELNLKIRISYSFILLAILGDGLDGILARKLRKSEIGVILDSMADMTSFVIAPSIFIYFVYSNAYDFIFYRSIYLIAALILFLSFGIIRLASFHIMKEKELFIGLPTPASTIILLNLAFLKIDFIYILPAVVIIGAAMASDIKFPKPRMRMNLVATILIILSLIFGKGYYAFAPILLLIAIIIYVIIGPIFNKKFVNLQ